MTMSLVTGLVFIGFLLSRSLYLYRTLLRSLKEGNEVFLVKSTGVALKPEPVYSEVLNRLKGIQTGLVCSLFYLLFFTTLPPEPLRPLCLYISSISKNLKRSF